MIDALVIALVLVGAAFSLLAAIGIIRMPDLYTRMQSATKAGSLGVACTVLAAAVHFRSTTSTLEALLVTVFLFATAPIASLLIARAAYAIRVPLWTQTTRDDLNTAHEGPPISEQTPPS